MSAPAGWYPQPDGRQRYWDGTQWTEHFHGEASATEAHAEAAQAPLEADQPAVTTYGDAGATYGQPVPTTYGQPAYGQQPYGAPAGAPAKSGLGKGCLIAGIVGLVLLALLTVVGIIVFNKAKNEVDKVIASATSQPYDSGLPSLPGESSTPDASSSPLELSAAIGKGFTLPDVTVVDGWTITKMEFLDMYSIDNMTANPAPSADVILFDLEFMNGTEVLDTTMCSGEAGKTEITCLPLSKDVSTATEVVAKNTF